jgi:hypothetical protein
VADPVDALVDREQRADGEQDQRDDEGVEVALGAEAELMLLGLLAAGPRPAEQQQGLVPGVGYRVRGLSQQRRRAGDDEGGELDRRDAQVGGQRGQDSPLAAFVLSADPRSLLPGSRRGAGLVDQQHGDVVAHRVGPPALAGADQLAGLLVGP